jgi:hypothetical protein
LIPHLQISSSWLKILFHSKNQLPWFSGSVSQVFVWWGVSQPITLSPPTQVEFKLGCDNKSILVLEYPALLSLLPPELPSSPPQPQPLPGVSKDKISDNRVRDVVMIRPQGECYTLVRAKFVSALGRCRLDVVSSSKGIFFLYRSSLCLFFSHKGLA